MPWWAFYGAWAGMTFVVASASEPQVGHRTAAAAFLFGCWAVSNLASLIWTHATLAPYLDGLAILFFMIQWQGSRQDWLAGLIFLRLIALAGYLEYARQPFHDAAAKYVFDLDRNILFAMQLCCVTLLSVYHIITQRGSSRGRHTSF